MWTTFSTSSPEPEEAQPELPSRPALGAKASQGTPGVVSSLAQPLQLFARSQSQRVLGQLIPLPLPRDDTRDNSSGIIPTRAVTEMGLSATPGPAWCQVITARLQVITGRLSVITAPSVFVCLRLTSVCTPLGRCREVGGERHAAQGGTARGALGQSTHAHTHTHTETVYPTDPPPPPVTCVCMWRAGIHISSSFPPPLPPA